MPLYQAVLLALLQGLTEFLPISSSAHLALAHRVMGGIPDELTFDIALHFGTLLAVMVYFARDWVQVVAGGFGVKVGGDEELRRNRHLLWWLAVASVPVAVIGLLFKEQAETTLRNPYVIGTMLIAVGLLMGWAEHVGERVKGVGAVSLADATVIGLAQALAIVPGTSRSGITMTAGLFRGLDRHASARFSFLLSTPAIGGAALKSFYDLYKAGGLSPSMQMPFAVGVLVSAVSGFAVISLLLRFLRTRTLRPFVAYRIVFGIIVLALAAIVDPSTP